MLGLDQYIAGLSGGATLGVVLALAFLLGLRHASDPDHLAAVSSLSAADRRGRGFLLGLTWGAGHGTTLVLFGLPILLWQAYLPGRLHQLVELAIGLIIIALALRLLLHRHPHGRVRGPAQAFVIGLIHGTGGSAGVGVLLLASLESRVLGTMALLVFAVGTALSMTLVSGVLGSLLARIPGVILRPALGAPALLFGVWYSLGSLGVAPYSL